MDWWHFVVNFQFGFGHVGDRVQRVHAFVSATHARGLERILFFCIVFFLTLHFQVIAVRGKPEYIQVCCSACSHSNFNFSPVVQVECEVNQRISTNGFVLGYTAGIVLLVINTVIAVFMPSSCNQWCTQCPPAVTNSTTLGWDAYNYVCARWWRCVQFVYPPCRFRRETPSC